jgi:hypothetical protein
LITPTLPPPGGYFRPDWANRLVYPAAYLLAGLDKHAEVLGNHLFGRRFVPALLQCVDAHYRTELFFNASEVSPTWLDQGLAYPVFRAGLKLLHAAGERYLAYWPPERKERIALIETTPEANVLARLLIDSWPEADDPLVKFTLEGLFMGTDNPTTEWQQRIKWLYEEGPRQRVYRSADLYATLVFNSGLLLRQPDRYSEDLVNTASDFCFTLPPAEVDHRADLLVMQARVLERLTAFGLPEPARVAEWLRTTGRDENVATETLIACLNPFLDNLNGYPPSVKRALEPALHDLAADPRHRGLWQLNRFRGDVHATLTA